MSKIITDLKNDQIALELFESVTHPVIRVDCDLNAMLYFERHDALRLWLNASTPSESRRTFLQHVRAAIEELSDATKDSTYWNRPLSSSGRGLSRNQIRAQTLAAVMKSRHIEAKLRDIFLAKYSTERLTTMLEKLKVTKEDIERINAESPLAGTGLEYNLVNLGDRDEQGRPAIELKRKL